MRRNQHIGLRPFSPYNTSGMGKMMGVHKIFSENLRSCCDRMGSIAEVCKRTGINRQQFNRYLSGKNLPNRNTLNRLTSVLGIEEIELFTQASERAVATDSFLDSFPMAKQVLTDTTSGEMLRPGYYNCYFPLQGFDDFLVKSLVKVSVYQGQLCFVRHTIFRSGISPKLKLATARHSGVVLNVGNSIYLIGVDRGMSHHLSFIVFEGQQFAQNPVVQGLSITKSENSHFASRVCLEWIGKSASDLKRQLPLAGVLSAIHRELNPMITLLMTTETEQHRAQLEILALEKVLLANGQPELVASSSFSDVPADVVG